MRKIFLLLCLFLAAQLSAQSRFIRRDGDKLIDSTGQAIQLNGVNLGGWLLWEGWIWGKGFVKESTIYSNLYKLVGDEAAQNFRTSVYKNFITEADIKAISENCFNVVRVPFNHRMIENYEKPGLLVDRGVRIFDQLLEWCEKYKVYVVLDLHAAPGGNSGFFIADPDKKKLWEDEQNIRRTAILWKAIAKRYKDRTIIAGYDLLNEPGFPDGKKLMTVYRELIDSVRSVDKNHLLFLEGNKLATDFSMFSALPDPNCALSYHLYTFFNKKEKNARKKMAKQAAFAKKLNAPLWCGEWAQNDNATVKMTKRVMTDNTGVDGLCAWTWKVVLYSEKAPYMNRIPASDAWKKTIAYAVGKGKPPAKEEALKAMNEFTEAVKYAKNTPNKELLEILRSCK